MTMSEENKYNSFFQDSPIPVPPTEEAWSLMQQKLNAQMPVGAGGAGGAGGFGRVFRLPIYRWGIPAATVAVVTVGVWLGLHKEGHRHSGRPAVQVVSRGAAAKPLDSVDSANVADSAAGLAPLTGSAAGSAPVAGSAAPGNVTDRGQEMKSGKSADSVAQGEGTDGDRAAAVKTGGSMKTGGIVKTGGSMKKIGRAHV